MKSFSRLTALAALLFYLGLDGMSFSQTTSTSSPDWMTRPLSLLDAVNVALEQNATILKAQNDFTATSGLIIQTRAVALPQLTASGQYKDTEPTAIETLPISLPAPEVFQQAHQSWSAGFQLVQTIYGGGKLMAAIKAARLTKDQARANYETVVQDTLLNTRTAYYDALLAREQITVHEASVKLLQNELNDQRRRYKAGTVPEFNVLRAEVQLANEQPLLIQARNSYRIAKNDLSNLLGYNLPTNVWEDIPLDLSDKLDARPYAVDLPSAIERALQTRTELVSLQKAEALRKLN
ncbi:MAG: TolC family protein, partial [Limisphaerales bacterium]